MKIHFFIGLSLLSFVSCSSIQTDFPYQLIGKSKHLELKNDGYVVGIEKRNRNEIGINYEVYSKRFKELDSNLSSDVALINKRNEEYLDATNDQKAMVVTHIKGFFEKQFFLYNAYEKYQKENINYENGFKGLKELESDILKRLNQNTSENNYTHIFIVAMGWHNDQYDTVVNINKIVRLLEEEKTTGKFKPLIIGLTWPSNWFNIEDSWLKRKFGYFFSASNKANDADEIGYTIANWLINYSIPTVKKSYNKKVFPKVVIIGHSFGARILSRAIFSKNHLNKKVKATKNFDIFFGLQGAFSTNRFIERNGIEGWPYSDLSNISGSIIMTSSLNDKYVEFPALYGAKYIGSKYAIELAEENEKVFNLLNWPIDGQDLSKYKENNKVTVINATKIIKDHNDVFNKKTAKMIWEFIDAE